MALLFGPATVTRYSVLDRPAEPDFEQAAFRELAPGSEVRQRVGFVPFEPGAEYRVGQHRWAFRVRIDTVRPDPTAVAERLKQLEKTERERTGRPYVPAKVRRQLRQLAEEELVVKASPRSRIVECVLDNEVLYLGTAAATALSFVNACLGAVGFTVLPKTPWQDRGEEDVPSAVVEPRRPGDAVLGCRFLKALLGDPDIVLEPVAGAVTLQTPETRVTLRGAVVLALQPYLAGEAELLSARMLAGETTFRFEALPFRVAGARLATERHDEWTERLDARLEAIASLYDQLDARYAALATKLHAAG